MALDPVQAHDRDALAIQRPTQAPPEAAQARLRHLEPIDRQGDPELSRREPLPRTDQLQQLAPRQPAGDDGQRGALLPCSGSDQSAEDPLARVFVEPRAEQAQGIDQRVDPAQAIQPPLPIGVEPTGGHQYSPANITVSTRAVTVASAGSGEWPVSPRSRYSILKKIRVPSIVSAP